MNSQPIHPYKIIELAEKDLSEWDINDIKNVVSSLYSYGRQALENKKRWWLEMTKLYLNQYRKSVQEIQIGSKLLFNQFSEIFASIDSDERRVEFDARNPVDSEIVKYTNAVAEFDFEEMDGRRKWRELNWNIIFFGSGILDVSTYDTKNKILKPEVQSPFTFFIDPKATSIENARFAGRFIYKTYYELINDRRLDPEEIKSYLRGGKIPTPSSQEQRIYETQAKRILIGDNYYEEPLTHLSLLEILEIYFYVGDNLYVVWTDPGVNNIFGFEKVDYRDAENNKSLIPFVFFPFIKTGFSIWGIGLPDILEDTHRVSVILKNSLLRGAILDATPSFLFNVRAVLNPKDLLTKEINKSIPMREPPSGQVVPFPKSNAITSDVLVFMNLLENEALGFSTTIPLSRGIGAGKKSATQIALEKAKADLKLSSLMRNILTGEYDFWYRWLKRHQRFMKENDEKLIKIVGYGGAKRFMSVTKSDFIPKVDPTIKVVSSLVSEPTKILRRRELAEIMNVLGELQGNPREALKLILNDMDLTPEQIRMILPPLPQEVIAQEENEMINRGEIPEIHENDDDLLHIREHEKAINNEIKEIHIKAHLLNYLRKANQRVPKPIESTEEAEEISMEEMPTLGQLGRELTIGTLTEGVQRMVATEKPRTRRIVAEPFETEQMRGRI